MPANGAVGTVDARVREWRAVNAEAREFAEDWPDTAIKEIRRHIATFSPDVVGRLLDVVEALNALLNVPQLLEAYTARWDHAADADAVIATARAALAQLATAVGGTP